MRFVFFALFCCLVSLAHANEEAAARFNALMADDTLRQQAYTAGQERIVLCGHCHGSDGNSKREHIPNLAGQNPRYLFSSFEKFADGQRSDYVMSQLAQILSMEERVNIAVYFSQQTVKPKAQKVDPALSLKGAAVFKNTCIACHGAHAQGQENAPRLAGQPAEYLRRTLTRFRNKDPSRAGSPMLPIAAILSEQDITALAAYLSQLSATAQ
ncbi:c-type cytochrome [Stutzerimonas azotifigens]|uniref:C-type cytochrome n=1 Tax=Stutzerimonas azotifigens TaxID=291995 RepID=A0ABR5Z6S8_9GAMM|nr:c-type cytochrome [Stutzerimonas azotifigens]MBA1275836.1 c-type cytochrome [Stutzerimonas azotifigens]